jgi:hypothetical protein
MCWNGKTQSGELSSPHLSAAARAEIEVKIIAGAHVVKVDQLA